MKWAGNIGGRTRAIVIHPDPPNRIWVASTGGGVWRSDDGGNSWSPVDDKMANLAVCSMVMDPTDPDVVYAGTGEGFTDGRDNRDDLRGAGIFWTRNGTQWSQVPGTKQFHYVNRLAISKDGKVLLAATQEGIYRSEDPGRITWTLILPGLMADVKFDPSDNQKAVAGGWRNGTAYYSTNGGKTWSTASLATPWEGRVELAYAAKDPSTVYASVEMDTGEIWRSTDGGKTYEKRDGLNENGVPANYLGEQGWYDNAIWVGDPKDSDLVMVGGIDLWRSTDGGNTLERISQWNIDESAHADHHAVAAHPEYDSDTNNTVFFGNDGGIYKMEDVKTVGGGPDHAQGWINLVNGYAVTQFYSGAGNPNTGTIIGGAQDNGTLAYTPADGVNGWKEIFGGDGGFGAADSTDDRYFYGEYVWLELHRNDDGATSSDKWWERYIDGRFWNENLGNWDWKPLPFHIPDARRGSLGALFIAPFALDPNDSNRILAGGATLWRTNDAKTQNTDTKGPTWSAIKAPVGSFISAIAIAPGDSATVWVGHVNGEVYKSANATHDAPSWELIGEAGQKPLPRGRYCTRIVIDPKNHNGVYVTFGGYRRANVWKTTNGDKDWTDIGISLPEAPVRGLAIHPRNSEFLYVGTGVGVFTSEDAGESWSPTNEGPTNCPIFDFFWMNETLVCVTYGRGMFQIDLSGA
jgi:photosystem II stability/assembly factor-like uncharacterized protein